jgi:hypothetical protein
VAKGLSQIQGQDYDETFAPVVRFDSLLLVCSNVPAKGFVPQQIDIKAAVLYGELKETIYMHLPRGNRDGNNIAHLKRCIDGLKQSPREWYSHLTSHLRRYGFETFNFDPYMLWHKSDQFNITMYVDDLTSYGPPGYLMDTIVLGLKTEFEIINMGQLHWLVEIEITFNHDSIELSQGAFIDKMLARFQINDSHPMLLPIDPNTWLMKENQDLTLRNILSTNRLLDLECI